MISVEEEKEQRPNLRGGPWCGVFLGSSPPLIRVRFGLVRTSTDYFHPQNWHTFCPTALQVGSSATNSRGQRTLHGDSVNISGLRICQSDFFQVVFYNGYIKAIPVCPSLLSTACCDLLAWSWAK